MRIVFWIIVFIFLTAGTWFGFERGVLYWQLHTPLPDVWIAANLTNGELFYGVLSGVTRDTIKLTNVYVPEKFTRPSPEASASSSAFGLNGGIEPEVRYIPVFRSLEIFLNRAQVLYWQPISPASPVMLYLK